MEIEKMNDFVVDTKGHCFICLNKVPLSEVKLDPEGLSSSSFYSLKTLSRHLKMNMGKVFSDEELISQTLLEKVQGSTLKVVLCRECLHLNNAFKALSRTLEKVEMEMTSCLHRIKKKLNEAEEEHFRKLYVKQEHQSVVGGLDGKLKIVEALRTEAIKKCSSSLRCDPPRVKIQKLTVKEVNMEMLKIKMASRRQKSKPGKQTDLALTPENFAEPAQSSEGGYVKVEGSISDSIPDVDWDMEDGSHYPQQLDEEVRGDWEQQSTSTKNDGRIVETTERGAITNGKSTINPETGKHKCSICLTEFTTKNMFRAHYKSVHLNVRIKCRLCDKTFNYHRSYLQHHKSVHLGVKFKCQVCDREFGQKQHLKRHLQTKCKM